MALTNTQAIILALTKLGRSPADISVYDVNALIGSALESYAKRVARGDDYRTLQKKFTPVTVAAGLLDLDQPALLTALFDPCRSVVIPPNSNAPAVYVKDLKTLEWGGLPADCIYFSARGGELVFRDLTGSTSTLAGSATLYCNYIPTLAEISPENERAFVAALAEEVVSAYDPRKIEQDARELADKGDR